MISKVQLILAKRAVAQIVSAGRIPTVSAAAHICEKVEETGRSPYKSGMSIARRLFPVLPLSNLLSNGLKDSPPLSSGRELAKHLVSDCRSSVLPLDQAVRAHAAVHDRVLNIGGSFMGMPTPVGINLGEYDPSISKAISVETYVEDWA